LPEGRVYTDGEELYLPSVSTVLDEKPTPEGIKQWKKNNDGSGGTTHWRDILQYKSNRGTLIHYNLLKDFDEEDIYSEGDEGASEEELKLEGDWDRYKEDLAYAEEAWEQIKEIRGINQESVLNVECFVTNDGVGYAGQFDLLYEDDGDVVLADIKTSKYVYDKHLVQATAYAYAVDIVVDRMEILRINPDGKTWEVSRSDEWVEDRADLYKEFCDLREQLADDKIAKLRSNVQG